MADRAGVTWPTCEEDGCIGIRLAQGGNCLTHATARNRDKALERFGETGDVDARGVPITDALLSQILATARRDSGDHPTFRAARFDQATFYSTAAFFGATFEGLAGFSRATFRDYAGFDGPPGTTFQGLADFRGSTFQGTAGFDGATFKSGALFSDATFQGIAGFAWASFRAVAYFSSATFEGLAGFSRATFQGNAAFTGATIQGIAGFDGATFRHDAWFGNARFEQARQLGPLLAHGVLALDGANFAQKIQIEASTLGLSCQRTRFPAGVQFRLRGAQIILDDADLSSPSILMGIAALSDARLARREQRLVRVVRRLAPQDAMKLSARPRLLSVQGANVAGLAVSNVDLAECRFAGAHNLDRLRLESGVSFSTAPVRLPWDWRQVIAEERAWRAARSKPHQEPAGHHVERESGPGGFSVSKWPPAGRSPSRTRGLPGWPRTTGPWVPPQSPSQSPPAWLDWYFGKEWPTVLPAGQIALLYRALRKGREDAKDEPGAADFYYGEMEMRRHADDISTDKATSEASGGHVERAILTIYWLVSGYGLRAWRALAWLAAVTAVFAVGFHVAGFTRPPQPISYWTSLLYAVRATLSLTDPEVQLTAWGKLLQALLRLSGPVLLGLALLAIRARTKR